MKIDPSTRLEAVLDLPLGTVLKGRDNLPYVFVGMRRNTAGLEFWFHPDVRYFRHVPMCATYSLVRGAFAMFPELESYVKDQS